MLQGAQTHFEVHVLTDERWMIDATSTEEGTAREDAEEFLKRAQVRGVKVIKETFNPATDRSAARVVYEYLKPVMPKRKHFQRFQPRRQVSVTKPTNQPEAPMARAKAAPVKESNKGKFIAWVSLIVAAALAYVFVQIGG